MRVAKREKTVLKSLISTSELASICRCSESNIARLTREGRLQVATQRGKRLTGRYVLGDAVGSFIENLLRDEDPNEREYIAARADRMRASARMTQLELAHVNGDLVKLSKVRSIVMNMLSIVKNHVLAIPTGCSRLLLGVNDLQKINAILTTACALALREADSFNIESFKETSTNRERKHLDDDDDEAALKIKKRVARRRGRPRGR